MTGVAATSINGETIDSVAGLQRKGQTTFTVDEIERWKTTIILIIDEISFMSTRQIIKLHTNLQKACENYRNVLGGLNIVFTGDFS